MSGLSKVSAAVLAACTLTVSCYDDTALQDKLGDLSQQYDNLNDQYGDLSDQVDILVDRLYTLEKQLNGEIAALKAMVNGKLFITKVSTNVTTGVTTIIVNDGYKDIEIQVLPDQDLSKFLTYYVNGNGDKCWAYIDENGKVVPFYDNKGSLILIEKSFPQVVVEDGDTYIIVGGVKYPMSGNSVFSDYELITDQLTGEVYAVKFTFGEDMTFTVTVDGAAGFRFVQMSVGMGSVSLLENYYVPVGMTERVQIQTNGVVDYVPQLPDGWKVKEFEDIYMGAKYLDITAPSAELIQAGLADAEGQIKIMAVLEGGKASISKMYLTTEPFENLSVSFGKVDIKPYTGLMKYIYGVTPKAEYDPSEIYNYAVSNDILNSFQEFPGYSVETSAIYDIPVSEGLTPGDEYVLWAMPALYQMDGDDAGYFLQEGLISKLDFTYYDVDLKVTKATARDAELEMELDGVDSYYMRMVTADDFFMEDVVYGLNAGLYDVRNDVSQYTGSVFDFFDMTASADTEYVVWFAVAENDKEYTEKDIIVYDFATMTFVSGGSINVTPGEIVAGPKNIEVPLSAEGAYAVYYSFLTTANASKYADDAAIAEYLINNGKTAYEPTLNVKLSDFITSIKVETEYVLFAIAVDASGKYGSVLNAKYSTTPIIYNDLVVELSIAKNDPYDVVIDIATTGGEAVEYLYWVGRTAETFWKSTTYLGGSVETAQAYMFLKPTDYRLVDMATKYPVVDGSIKMTDLALKANYVIVAMAKDAHGGYSKAAELKFTTRSVSLGDIVYATDPRWEESKPVLNWLPEKFEYSAQLTSHFAFTYDCPDDMTAYVLCGTQSYIDDGGTITDMTIEDVLLKVIESVDKPTDRDILWDEKLWEETGSQDAWKWFRYQHGSPLFGNAVVWAVEPDAHANCQACASYTGGLDVITYHADEEIEFRMPYAKGEGDVDKVYIALKKGNDFYEVYVIDVPDEYFEAAKQNGQQ